MNDDFDAEYRNRLLILMRLTPRRAALLLVVFLIAAAAAYKPLADLVFACRLLFAVRALASGSTGKSLPVEESQIGRRLGQRELTALLYRPTGSLPRSAVMVVPGISELGCYQDRKSTRLNSSHQI